MPLEGIANLPAGAHLFLDANIFIYAFLGHSSQCRNLFGRCASEQVFGITIFEVINEVNPQIDGCRGARHRRYQEGSRQRFTRQTARNRRIDRILGANIGDLWFEYTFFAVRRGSIVPCSERPIAVRASYQRLSHLGGNGRKWR